MNENFCNDKGVIYEPEKNDMCPGHSHICIKNDLHFVT